MNSLLSEDGELLLQVCEIVDELEALALAFGHVHVCKRDRQLHI